MASMHEDLEKIVTIPIPGVDGVTLVWRPDLLAVDTQQVQAAASIIAHWLAQQNVHIHPRLVRDALRRFTSPWLLGETALAHILFDSLPSSEARGAALQSLLQDAIDRIAPGPDASRERCRGYLILRQLYLERRMPQQISRELGLSGRQYQRCLFDALVRVSQMLVHGVEDHT